MRIHLVQFNIAWEDKPANHAVVRSLVDATDPPIATGDLIVLPEMFDTGFSLRVEATADATIERPGDDPTPDQGLGPSTAFAMALARHHHAWVLAGITLRLRQHANEHAEPMGVNRAIVIDPHARIAAHYDKIHPFTFGREGERFIPGHAARSLRLGDRDDAPALCPIVCYDLRFPELFRASLHSLPMPEVFAVIANWPATRQAHWRALCIARAIENLAYVVAVNRVGRDPHLGYTGGSIIVDPMGRVVAEAPPADPDRPRNIVLSASLDLAALRAWRAAFPALRDRRRWDGTHANGLLILPDPAGK